MQNSKQLFWPLICLYYFVAALYALIAYPFWHLPELVMPFFFFAFSIIMLTIGQRYFKIKHIDIIILAILAQLVAIRGNLNGVIEALLKMLPFFTFVILRDEFKPFLYVFLRRAFTLLLAISLVGWLLHLAGVSLPYFLDTYGWSDKRGDVQYIYENYWVFLHNLRMEDLILNRFSCVFLEPGYVGCLMAVFLYLEKFNMRKLCCWIFFASLIVTFSVAGYVITLFAFVLSLLEKNKHRIVYVILAAVGVLFFYSFFANYRNGDNAVNELILERLAVDDHGDIVGNNRTEEAFDDWFSRDFINSSEVVLGDHQRYLELFAGDINVGWKFYVANYGILALVLYVYYLFYLLRRRPSYRTDVLFFIYLLIFARGHFFNFASLFMILYYVGIYNQLSKDGY